MLKLKRKIQNKNIITNPSGEDGFFVLNGTLATQVRFLNN